MSFVLPETLETRCKQGAGPVRATIVAIVADEHDRNVLAGACQRQEWGVQFCGTYQAAIESANRIQAPVILCDRDVTGSEWRHAVQALAASPHGARVILISRVLDDYLWREVGLKGGHDVLSKPLQEDDVVRAVKLAWSYWNSTVKT
jgi:FixJ family two-component response regulator